MREIGVDADFHDYGVKRSSQVMIVKPDEEAVTMILDTEKGRSCSAGTRKYDPGKHN